MNLEQMLADHERWFTGAPDWKQANLSGANLSGTYLYMANLSGANLSGANLYRADLSGANLFGADLRWANLSGANLLGANLSGAYVSQVILLGAYWDENIGKAHWSTLINFTNRRQ